MSSILRAVRVALNIRYPGCNMWHWVYYVEF